MRSGLETQELQVHAEVRAIPASRKLNTRRISLQQHHQKYVNVNQMQAMTAAPMQGTAHNNKS
jgi:hypothetical protein